jgi:CHAT domain-containing protein/tetratricopeptide (TPR) repeat protein
VFRITDLNAFDLKAVVNAIQQICMMPVSSHELACVSDPDGRFPFFMMAAFFMSRTHLRIHIAVSQNQGTDFGKIEPNRRRASRKTQVLSLGKAVRCVPSVAAILVILAAPSRIAGPQMPDEATLIEAKRLAWLNNWADAAELLDQLERSHLRPIDEATALFSRAAHIRGNIEAMSLPTAAAEVASMLDREAIRRDPQLHLQLLSIKGDIEFQYNLHSAQTTWEEAKRLAIDVDSDEWNARADGELGAIAFLNGEIYAALRLVSGALLKAEFAGDVASQIRYRTALGEGLAEFGRPADAIRFFDKALELSSSTNGAYFPFTAYLGKARLLAATERRADGLRMLHEGLAEARRKELKVREARILTVLGELASSRGEQREAIGWLKEAADVAHRAGLDRIEAEASSSLASLQRDAGDNSSAVIYAKRSVAAAQRTGDLYHLPQMMAILAEIEAKNGNFSAAEEVYAQATDAVNGLLRDFPHPRHKNTLIATMSRVFQGHFELALDNLHDVAKAFAVVESAKAHGLVDLLHGSSTRQAGAWDQHAVRRVAELQRSLSHEMDQRRRSELLDQLWELEMRSFRSRDVGQGYQAPSTVRTVSIPRLQSSLADNELLIEYVLSSPRSFALAISRDQVTHYELADRKTIEAAVDMHLAAVRSRRDGRFEAAALYRLLVEPVIVPANKTRLVIVPDGKLHVTAFGALMNPDGGFLVESHVISYAPSATAYYLLSESAPERVQKMSLLGVGGAKYNSNRIGDLVAAVRSGGFFDPSSAPLWSPIPYSFLEVSDLAATGLGTTTLLTGDRASEVDLKRMPLSTFRVLHFALHSAIDADFPDRSALVLSSRRGDEEDGLLQAREVVHLDLNADMVTLSACDAGSGTLEGIAGVNSLVQAFLMAGSRSVVASVWPADDMFTAALMKAFYSNLRQGLDKAEALTLAKRELLKVHGPNAVPFFWAGFRLVGDSHGTVLGEER